MKRKQPRATKKEKKAKKRKERKVRKEAIINVRNSKLRRHVLSWPYICAPVARGTRPRRPRPVLEVKYVYSTPRGTAGVTVTSDAYAKAIGAVLSQSTAGLERPVAYAS